MSPSTHPRSRTRIPAGLAALLTTLLAAAVLVPAGATASATPTRPAGAVVHHAAPAQAPAARRRGLHRYPQVFAHRGASGYRPEHTPAAYALAAKMGADFIEPDLVMTKDGVLVDRHEPEISGTTDVADHPEFANRKTTKMLDGVPTTGWFTEDFTLKELRTLRAVERLPATRPQNTVYNGRFRVPTFAEDLRQRVRLSRKYHRTIGIIPEIKHSTYFHDKGLNPERAFVKLVKRFHLNRRHAPIWLQSFELTNLQTIRQRPYRYHGKEVFLTEPSPARPYDLVARGDTRTYDDLLQPASLQRLSRTIQGIGPDKQQVIPRNADGTLGTPTRLVADAHAAHLRVTPYTFRAENQFLPTDYRVGTDPNAYGRSRDEDLTFLRAGVDALFCDQPDICVSARNAFVRGG